jgi:hypothetical protein
MNKFFSLWKLCIERYKVARVGFFGEKEEKKGFMEAPKRGKERMIGW